MFSAPAGPKRRPSAGQSHKDADDKRTERRGCYDPAYEHDACGVAFVADLKPAGQPPRSSSLGLTALENLAHRGAFGADPGTGDGAGALVQLPHRLLPRSQASICPGRGATAPGWRFSRARASRPQRGRWTSSPKIACEEGSSRSSDGARCRSTSPPRAKAPEPSRRGSRRSSSPARRGRAGGSIRGDALERRCFVVRKRVEHADSAVYFPSLSTRTFVYKGMLAPHQLRGLLPRPHRRAPREPHRARPFEVLDQHVPLLAARAPLPARRPQRRDQHPRRQPELDARPRGAPRERAHPKATSSGSSRSSRREASDSATFDEVLELLHLAGRPLPHAVLMMIPEAWENHAEMDPARRAFYGFHASLDGALGRAGGHRLHRRDRGGRGARPQRPAPGSLLGDR